MDRRRFNGGHSTKGKAGRKPKDEELKILEKLSPHDDLAIDKLVAGVKKGEFQYIKLFMEYRFGKPKQSVDHTTGNQSFNIPIGEWLK